MIEDKQIVLQLFGCILKNPSILSQKDKYFLSPDDFNSQFEKKLFITMYSLYEQGAKYFSILDIDNFLKTSKAAYALWEKENGLEYLQDAEEFSDIANFDYYYTKLKKINALNGLSRIGYDISDIFCENPMTPQQVQINENFENLTTKDIFDCLKKQLLVIEQKAGTSGGNVKVRAGYQIRDLLEDLKKTPDVGPRLQGDYFNTIVRGARKGKFYLRSASSGTGKTRNMVGDACYLSYPIRYNWNTRNWEWCGGAERTLYIATEQSIDEIQTMVLAYLSGINEDKILYSTYSQEEEKVINDALLVMEKYCDNLIIAQIPNPNIEQIQNTVRSSVLEDGVENVFYDYIFSNPALLNEYRDLKVQEHQILGMFSNELKNLAVDLNIFVMSATQTNAQAEDNGKSIKNEGVIRGSRAIVDKIDIGVVIMRPTEEDLHIVENFDSICPNLVTDVYKVRRGRFTQVRIWSYVDLGTCRRRDLFVTDSSLKPFSLDIIKQTYDNDSEIVWDIYSFLKTLNEIEEEDEVVLEMQEGENKTYDSFNEREDEFPIADDSQEDIKEPAQNYQAQTFIDEIREKIERDRDNIFKGLL